MLIKYGDSPCSRSCFSLHTLSGALSEPKSKTYGQEQSQLLSLAIWTSVGDYVPGTVAVELYILWVSFL